MLFHMSYHAVLVKWVDYSKNWYTLGNFHADSTSGVFIYNLFTYVLFVSLLFNIE